jgi:heat shock protein HspQ
LILAKARFSVGQLVYHAASGIRGVVIDVDPTFIKPGQYQGALDLANIPFNQIWYHVLVDGSDQGAYVAEPGLVEDQGGEPVDHPQLPTFFVGFDQDHKSYVSRRIIN